MNSLHFYMLHHAFVSRQVLHSDAGILIPLPSLTDNQKGADDSV